MPTPAEQKALAFVALVILLGGAVRVVKGGALGSPATSPAEQQALARQAFAASSTATANGGSRSGKGKKSAGSAQRRRYAGAKFDSTGVLIQGSGVSSASLSPTGFPPPGPRIDIDVRGHASAPSAGTAFPGADPPGAFRGPAVDLDVADTVQIAQLPRVGRALAQRIVANRDSLGPFGSLSGLKRVKGVGPATMQRLAPLVTFSGQARR